MANYDADNMLQLFLLLTWTCLSQPVNMNGIFKQIFFDKDALTEICTAASLWFFPGLFEAIQASQPPPIEFWLSLPSDGHGLWGDYGVTLFKKGEGYLIYVGSGTEATKGLPRRFRVYDNPVRYRDQLPEYVRRALDKDYKIVHRGRLVSTPIPPASKVPRVRLLLLSGEAALSFVFWAMYSRTKDYGIGLCCPWKLETFTYRGLCNHSALSDPVHGNFDLTSEQLEAIAAEAQERKRKQRQEYHQENKERSNAQSRAYHSEHKEENRVRDAQYKKDHKEEIQIYVVKHRAEAREAELFKCDVCNYVAAVKGALDLHFKGKAHIDAVEFAKNGPPAMDTGVLKKYRCVLCSFSSDFLEKFEKHKKTAKHKNRMRIMAMKADAELALDEED